MRQPTDLTSPQFTAKLPGTGGTGFQKTLGYTSVIAGVVMAVVLAQDVPYTLGSSHEDKSDSTTTNLSTHDRKSNKTDDDSRAREQLRNKIQLLNNMSHKEDMFMKNIRLEGEYRIRRGMVPFSEPMIRIMSQIKERRTAREKLRAALENTPPTTTDLSLMDEEIDKIEETLNPQTLEDLVTRMMQEREESGYTWNDVEQSIQQEGMEYDSINRTGNRQSGIQI
ncbi:MAG: hypothetical protein PHH70_00390 [Candidatus Gracilibacteria bacterium]|nr:hypothetical protein [Candidatus Gracilibacteria bacterium]